MNIEQMQARIAKKIRANDIHHKGRLTTEQIASIDAVTVYCWIHTGEWKSKHFKMWLEAIRLHEKASNAVN